MKSRRSALTTAGTTVRKEIIYGFALLEVVSYLLPRPVQAAIAITAYAFIGYCLLLRPRTALAYLVVFNLLAMAGWTYVTPEAELAANFWGLRAGGFSFNILFCGAVAFFCFIQSQGRRVASLGSAGVFLIVFIAYSLLLGIVYMMRGVNYPDNFVRDALSYLPGFIWVYFVGRLRAPDAVAVFRHGISATVAAMALSYVCGARFEYGDGNRFVLMSNFGFLVVFALPFCGAQYRRGHFIVLLGIMALLVASGSVFIGGKMIVIVLMTALWLLYRWQRNLFIWVVLAAVLIPMVNPAAQFAIQRMDESSLLRYKLTQVASLFEVASIHSLAATPTSMGNVAAEAVTTASYLAGHPGYLLAGKGFGGGVQDVYGYLAPAARPGYGYAEHDAVRDDFVRLHLPIFEVVLKAGLSGLVFYSIVLLGALRSGYTFSFIAAILLFTVFYNSKEMLLLTVLLLRLARMEQRACSLAARKERVAQACEAPIPAQSAP